MRLLRYLKPEWLTLLWAYAHMFVLALTTAFLAFLSGPALNFVFTGRLSDILRTHKGDVRWLWKLIPEGTLAQVETLAVHGALWVVPCLLVATAVIKGLAQTGQFFLMGRTSQRVLTHLRRDLFEALLAQSPAFYARRSHGDLLSRLTNDTGVVEQAFFYGCGPILRDTLSIIVLLGMCFGTDPKLSLFTFIVVPLAVYPLARFTRWLKRVSKGGQDAQGQINAVGYEALAGIRVVQSCQGEAHELQRLDAAAARYYADMCVSYFIRAVRTPTMETLGSAALAGLLALLGFRVQSHGADPAHYISFFAAIVLMYDPLKKLGNVSDYLAAGAAASERLFEVIDHPNAIVDVKGAGVLPRFEKRIAFEDVHFAYDAVPTTSAPQRHADASHTQPEDIAPTQVLRGVNLTLHAGQVVALVGPSGAGKSTLAHLLPRFYDVTRGTLSIDGMDVRHVSIASLRNQISVVSQDTFLFNTSVADNIAYARPGATLADVQRAAEAAYADEFIHRLPQGYDTFIGERGVTLSGGQRQRLAIARAILRDTPLLILDEATSSLDIESERYVQQALDALMRGRTALVIAHRLSTVRHADFIAVLRDGRVVEQGPHDTLVAQGGEYARLYAMQFADVPEVMVGQPGGMPCAP